MSILDTIVEQKRVEVLQRKQEYPLSRLSSLDNYRRKTNAMRIPEGLPGIIAEFKRKSPSRGPIHMDADVVEVATAYEAAGASAMSILTDRTFFGGSFGDLRQVRESCPELALLRKDFIIDPYQLHEASAYGADMVLLIAAILDRREVQELALEAASLGLHILFEVHHRKELEKFHPEIRYVGVNNRDLKTFKVDTGRSFELIADMPAGVVPVSESGLSQPEEIKKLWDAGYQLFLMGESFMKEKDPGAACRLLINSLI
ncbi:MAG: indole-3-glycerol phosphate synthase TrpC [Bacteroidota bacterium]|nr:indole-3-glycerol phosphate synthase TrpC [Bacteroidota bacterium]